MQGVRKIRMALGILLSRARRDVESNKLPLHWKQDSGELCDILEFATFSCSSSVFLNWTGFICFCSKSVMMWRMLKYCDRVCSQFWERPKPRHKESIGASLRGAEQKNKSRDWFHRRRGCPTCFSVEQPVWFLEERHDVISGFIGRDAREKARCLGPRNSVLVVLLKSYQGVV